MSYLFSFISFSLCFVLIFLFLWYKFRLSVNKIKNVSIYFLLTHRYVGRIIKISKNNIRFDECGVHTGLLNPCIILLQKNIVQFTASLNKSIRICESFFFFFLENSETDMSGLCHCRQSKKDYLSLRAYILATPFGLQFALLKKWKTDPRLPHLLTKKHDQIVGMV